MSTKPTLVTVELAKVHTHEGKAYKTGDTLNVSPAVEKWLRAQGVVVPATTKAKKEAE